MNRIALAMIGTMSLFGPRARAQQTLYVANNGAMTISSVPSGGGSFTTYATGFSSPAGVAMTANSTMYVSDNVDGTILRVPAGGGAATLYSTVIGSPAGMAVDAAGFLYVADQGNQEIRKIAPGGMSFTVLATNLQRPFGVTLDSTQTNLYFTDFNAQEVYRIPTAGAPAPTPLGAVSNPTGIAVDEVNGTILVGSNTIANATIRSLPIGGGSPTVYAMAVPGPEGLLLDGSGRLYVSTFGDDSIYRIPAGGGSLSLYATGFDTPYFMAFQPVPEPASVLLACGLAGGLVAARRRFRATAPASESGSTRSVPAAARL